MWSSKSTSSTVQKMLGAYDLKLHSLATFNLVLVRIALAFATGHLLFCSIKQASRKACFPSDAAAVSCTAGSVDPVSCTVPSKVATLRTAARSPSRQSIVASIVGAAATTLPPANDGSMNTRDVGTLSHPVTTSVRIRSEPAASSIICIASIAPMAMSASAQINDDELPTERCHAVTAVMQNVPSLHEKTALMVESNKNKSI
eukprot:SAG31_NODE_1849_length_7088_cov_2.647446_7_plen_202_part_00